jgi:hypothetical protein
LASPFHRDRRDPKPPPQARHEADGLCILFALPLHFLFILFSQLRVCRLALGAGHVVVLRRAWTGESFPLRFGSGQDLGEVLLRSLILRGGVGVEGGEAVVQHVCVRGWVGCGVEGGLGLERQQ